MIQRLQSIWLLLIGLCTFGTYSLPLYVGDLPNATVKKFYVPDDYLLFLLVVGIGILAVVTIFFFKKRKLQLRLCIAGILLTIGAIALEYIKTESFKQSNTFQSGSYQIGALLPVISIILFILAARGINKDEKLVKSLNRLR